MYLTLLLRRKSVGARSYERASVFIATVSADLFLFLSGQIQFVETVNEIEPLAVEMLEKRLLEQGVCLTQFCAD